MQLTAGQTCARWPKLEPARAATSQGTSSCSVFHSSFGTGLQSSPRTDSSKVNELSKLFVHAFIVKGSKSQRMKEHELTSVNDVQDGEEKNREKLRYWSGETNIHTRRILKPGKFALFLPQIFCGQIETWGFSIFSVVWQGLGISPERSPALRFTGSSSLSPLKTSKATLN